MKLSYIFSGRYGCTRVILTKRIDPLTSDVMPLACTSWAERLMNNLHSMIGLCELP
jgi:hypothetical protein